LLWKDLGQVNMTLYPLNTNDTFQDMLNKVGQSPFFAIHMDLTPILKSLKNIIH